MYDGSFSINYLALAPVQFPEAPSKGEGTALLPLGAFSVQTFRWCGFIDELCGVVSGTDSIQIRVLLSTAHAHFGN